MKLTVLLDLDDTLLDTNMGAFLPAYYQALAKHLNSFVSPDVMLAALKSGVNMMLANIDPSQTLQEVFEADFYPRLGIPKRELADSIDDFYGRVFPSLSSTTERRLGARELIDWAQAEGHQIAIATDPLFPRQATRERIRWAGLEPERFDLISSFETFHFSKSHAAYFAEVIGRLGWPDRPVVMVGNDFERDLVPAEKLGLMVYHVDGVTMSPIQSTGRSPAAAPALGAGNLTEVRGWLETIGPESHAPAFRGRDAAVAVLEATPGVLQSLVSALSAASWARAPAAQEWSMIELVCHLRDTEREVHRLQIKTLLEAVMPFVPRPDAAVWAKQRQYSNEDGPQALREFIEARIASLNQLRGLAGDIWDREARHAIFGPTNFAEVIGFMADHDRMHLQQAWGILAALK